MKHRTAFLFNNAKQSTLDMLSFKMGDSEFMGVGGKALQARSNLLYLELASQFDFKPVSFYANGLIYGAVDRKRLKLMQTRCVTIRAAGIKIIPWLFTDDSPNIAKCSTEQKKAYIKQALQYFDAYAVEYVLALEANEYMGFDQVRALADYFKTLSSKPLGLHLTPGKCDWSAKIKSIDQHYHQYGWGKSPSQIASMTKSVIASVKKPVIACEYNKSCEKSDAKAQGDAALGAGAAGTGCGASK